MNSVTNNIKKDIIIFEGLDRVGKSTHINLLINNLKQNNKKIQYFHCTGPDKYFITSESECNIYQASTYYNQFKDVKEFHELNKNAFTIFDRGFIGEYPYGIYYKRTSGIYNEFFVINKIFNSDLFKSLQDRILVVFLLADIDLLSKRIENSNEDNTVFTKYNFKNIKENIKYLTELYKALNQICIDHNLDTEILYSNNLVDITNNINYILEKI